MKVIYNNGIHLFGYSKEKRHSNLSINKIYDTDNSTPNSDSYYNKFGSLKNYLIFV